MRNIDTILIHCSATKEGRDFRAKDIDAWHKARGFVGIGYNYVVTIDGTIEIGRSVEIFGAHCPEESMNRRSIGICYIGGLDDAGHAKDTRTPAQKAALLQLVRSLKKAYPSITQVKGHRDIKGVKKECPCFNAIEEYQNV